MAEQLALLGIIIGILWGATNNIGMLLEKYVINDIPIEERDKKFFRKLAKNKIWLLGFSLDIGISTIFYIFGQLLVGPTLLPGLGAAGLIFMAIGSVKLIKEKFKIQDLIAIASLIIAIALLGFSGLLIDVPNYDFSEQGFLIRSSIFMAINVGLIIILEITQRKSLQFRGFALALISGLYAMMQNFVTAFSTAAMIPFFSGNITLFWGITMVIAGVISTAALVISIAKMQNSFKYTDARLAIPIREVPVQIGPAFIFISVFALFPPNAYSLPFLYIAIVLIIISSFLLGKRQAELEKIDLEDGKTIVSDPMDVT
jgi:MFS family permease